MVLLHIQLLLLLLPVVANGSKILVMVTTSSPSLFNLNVPIIEGLSSRQHDITLQSFYPLEKSLPNMKELLIKPPQFGGNEEFTKHFLLSLTAAQSVSEVYSYTLMFAKTCEGYLQDDSTRTLLAAGKQFDLVLVDGLADCALVVASMVGKHMVALLGSANFPWLYSDAPAPPSYVPNFYRRVTTSKMTFWQRLNNLIDVIGFRLTYEYMMQPTNQQLVSKHLPQAPTIEEAVNRVIVTLANADPVMNSPRPTMPNIIEIGGIHCREAKPLPKELNDFVERSGDDGFIIFGLGTNMKSKFLPPEVRDAILSAFSRLKQSVIWKFEAQLDNLPKNVKIIKWLPQQDLLGHPKARLFITHAGLLSLQEALFHAVPVIGIPLFCDQPGNIGRIEELGIGENLDFFNITADGLYNLINKVLKDKSFRNNAAKYSAILKDQIEKPIDRAIFWLEYILRYDGAHHLRPAGRDLNIFEYLLLDVITTILFVMVIVVVAILLMVKLVLKKLWFGEKQSTRKALDKKSQ